MTASRRFTGWDDQADWYDAHLGDEGDDLYRAVVLPLVLRQLDLKPGMRVLDCACGQGVVARMLARQGVKVTGVDASEALIAAARRRDCSGIDYRVGDARELRAAIGKRRFERACIVLALQDIDELHTVAEQLALMLEPGGLLVAVLTHPCFRVPQHSDWLTDAQGRRGRWIDHYASEIELAITTHPGMPDSAESRSWHRPLASYIDAFGAAGFGLIRCEEPMSPRRGEHPEEQRSAAEIPLFIGLTWQRLPA